MNQNTKKSNKSPYNNPIEILKNHSSGSGSADKLPINLSEAQMLERINALENQKEASQSSRFNKEVTLFSRTTHFEGVEKQQILKTIHEQIEQIQTEVKAIKSRTTEFNAEVQNVEKQVLQSLPEKPGAYHIHYMDYLIQFLRGLRLRIGEAKTWLEAMQTKRKKRGSLFMSLSKKKGTQYSLSQELQASRNVM